MKKIITTLTAVTFALGLAAAAQAQVAKTPEKPAVQSTQEVKTQVAPKEAVKPGEPVAKEAVTTADKTKEAAASGDKGKATPEAKKVANNEAKKGAKKEATPVAPKGQVEKKGGDPVATTPESAK
jgi:uncharacterized low-complexity protein